MLSKPCHPDLWRDLGPLLSPGPTFQCCCCTLQALKSLAANPRTRIFRATSVTWISRSWTLWSEEVDLQLCILKRNRLQHLLLLAFHSANFQWKLCSNALSNWPIGMCGFGASSSSSLFISGSWMMTTSPNWHQENPKSRCFVLENQETHNYIKHHTPQFPCFTISFPKKPCPRGGLHIETFGKKNGLQGAIQLNCSLPSICWFIGFSHGWYWIMMIWWSPIYIIARIGCSRLFKIPASNNLHHIIHYFSNSI